MYKKKHLQSMNNLLLLEENLDPSRESESN